LLLILRQLVILLSQILPKVKNYPPFSVYIPTYYLLTKSLRAQFVKIHKIILCYTFKAINCYHGLAALGLALGDPVMTKVGQLMLATEIRSVREYYHVRSYNRHLFPSVIQDYGTIGQFAEDAIFYYTLNWPCDPQEFPMRHACLVGIQVIPIISVSGLYMDQVLDWFISLWQSTSKRE